MNKPTNTTTTAAPAVEWFITSTHSAAECTLCNMAINAAVTKCHDTHSASAQHVDGQHVANVQRRVMPGTTVPPAPTTIYTVGVYIAITWATGTLMRTGIRTFEIEEASTILGGCRAIDIAIARCNGRALDGYSPTITPNAAELGWPLGDAS